MTGPPHGVAGRVGSAPITHFLDDPPPTPSAVGEEGGVRPSKAIRGGLDLNALLFLRRPPFLAPAPAPGSGPPASGRWSRAAPETRRK